MHAEASGRDAADDASTAARDSIDRAAAALATGGEELLRHVLTDAPVGLALVGPDLRWRWANPAFCRTAAVGPERLLGRAVAATALAAAAPALDAVLVDGSPREPSAGHPAVPRLRLRARRLVIGGRTAGLVVAALGPAEEPRPPATGPDLPHELERARIRLAVLDAAAAGSAPPWTSTPPAWNSPTSRCPHWPTWRPSSCWRRRRSSAGRRAARCGCTGPPRSARPP
ncbi:PAS domain-containing protein [Kitasatospora arboriphila]